MKFTYQVYRTCPKGMFEPFGEPLTLELKPAEEVRKPIEPLFKKPEIRAHSITLRSEDGEVAETWSELDGKIHRTPIH